MLKKDKIHSKKSDFFIIYLKNFVKSFGKTDKMCHTKISDKGEIKNALYFLWSQR